MINEIKTIIKNYLDNAKLCGLIVGIVVDGGIKISDKITIPDDLISGNLKSFISVDDKVKLIRNHGGQEFYIVEIIDSAPALKGCTLMIEPVTIGQAVIESVRIKDVKL